MKEKFRTGIIGCGKISGVYTQTMRRFSSLEIVACADLRQEISHNHCNTWNIEKHCTVDQLLEAADIDLVVILTPPSTHAPLCLKALECGKYVYCEKPLALTVEDAKRIISKAEEKRLAVGSAPDTVLGCGFQTARKIIDEGRIGTPVGACAFMITGGPESWHPNPFFLYDTGAGPLFDMGPYYLTALIHLLGPVQRVAALGSIGKKERFVGSGPDKGKPIPINVYTHLNGLLAFESGLSAGISLSFDAPGQTTTPRIEIYGTEGTLVVPDPNTFDGPVQLRGSEDQDFSTVPLIKGYTDNCRGVGVAEFVASVHNNRQSRIDASIALHVIDIMQSINSSCDTLEFTEIKSSCNRPSHFFFEDLFSIDD